MSVLVPFSTLTGAHHEPSGPFGYGGRLAPGSAGVPGGGPAGAGGLGGLDGGPGGPDGGLGGGPEAGCGRGTRADGGPAYTTHGGIPLPKSVIDRIVCDASVRRIVFGPARELLDVSRTAPPAIRAAVIARDHICTFPGCDRPASWTETHHLTHWTAGGDTAADTMTLARGFHHDVAHHDGWDLRLGPHTAASNGAPH
ncbi:MAG: HNH endonuclease signature motif containing protein, partial [Frankia sp.]